jgi:hypothetical protein
MSKSAGPFWVYKRPKTGKFQITLYPASGLSPEACRNWRRKGLSCFPLELAVFREPKTRVAAEAGAVALVEYLKSRSTAKNAVQGGILPAKGSRGPTVGTWLERFTTIDNNPRAVRLTAEGSPYSPDTLALYKMNFNCHLKNDLFMTANMDETEQAQVLSFTARIGSRQTKDGRDMAGTQAFEIVINFVRMAFKEYEEEHLDWRNPFSRIKAPRRKNVKRRDAVERDEIIKLFAPGVIADPLGTAVCAAMFFGRAAEERDMGA